MVYLSPLHPEKPPGGLVSNKPKLITQFKNKRKMKSIEELKQEWKDEQDADIKAILKADLDKIVPNNPMPGLQPPNEFVPCAVQLLSQTAASKKSSPDVSDCRLEFRFNNLTVKTYASKLVKGAIG
jgi:hypothetical protein